MYLFNIDVGKVADDVWQSVCCRVTDLIEDLLSDGVLVEEASSAIRLGHFDVAVGQNFDNGEPEVGVTFTNLLPVGVKTPSGLAPALNEVTFKNILTKSTTTLTANEAIQTATSKITASKRG